MIIDEEVVPLDDAGKFVPGPRRPSRSTLWRWALRGCRGRLLETARIGNQRVTSREAVRRFLTEPEQRSGIPSPISISERQKQAVAAIQTLATKNL